MDFKKALQHLKGQKFDYIFLDPPYKENFGEESLSIIADNDMLLTNGIRQCYTIDVFEDELEDWHEIPRPIEEE